MTIGRCSLTDSPEQITLAGNTLTIVVDITPAVANDVNEMKARRQQLANLVGDADVEVVPFTWSEDSSFDGFYQVMSVSVPSTAVMLNVGYIPGVQITLEQITGYANPWFEVTTQSVVRTNGHAITTPTTIMATFIASVTGERDMRPALTAPTVTGLRGNDAGTYTTIYEYVAPVAQTQYRYMGAASTFFQGGCSVEVKYGSTWYPVVGRDIPLATVWRISNGLIRLTAASGASGVTPGTIEIFNGAWQSANVAHWTNGAPSSPIGYPGGSLLASLQILRNSVEHVVVKVSGGDVDYTYSIQRGAFHIVSSWTAQTAIKGGAGSATAGAIAGTAITGGIRRTANDGNGNRMVYGTAAARTNDLTNTGCWYTAAATTGSVFFGCELAGSGAATPDTADALVGQFIGAVAWRQRVIVA